MLQLGPLQLGPRPHVAAAINDRTTLAEARGALDAGVDLLELRVDQFSSGNPAHVVEVAKSFAGIPLLATIRHEAEGGAWKGSEADRLNLYLELLPYVDAIDVELMAKEVLLEAVEAAHAASKLVLGSHHNFEATPSPVKLTGIANDGKLLGVDIVKIAAYCQRAEDLRNLAAFTIEHASKNLIVIGMGPHGKLSRVCFPALGSLLTYTYLGAATAPGQLTCDETIEYLKSFYPDYREEDAAVAASGTETASGGAALEVLRGTP